MDLQIPNTECHCFSAEHEIVKTLFHIATILISHNSLEYSLGPSDRENSRAILKCWYGKFASKLPAKYVKHTDNFVWFAVWVERFRRECWCWYLLGLRENWWRFTVISLPYEHVLIVALWNYVQYIGHTLKPSHSVVVFNSPYINWPVLLIQRRNLFSVFFSYFKSGTSRFF